MKTLITSWQTPFVLLLLFLLGLCATDAHDIQVDGMVFILAMYAFSAATGKMLTPNRTVVLIAGIAGMALPYLVVTDSSPEMGYFDSIPFAIFLTVAYFTAANTQQAALRSLKLVVLAAAGVGAWALHKGPAVHGYVSGMFDDSNMFAGMMFATLLPGIGFAAQAMADGRKRTAAIWGLVSALIAVTAVAAHSRGAWMSVFLAIAASLLLFRKSLGISNRKIAALLCAAVVIGVPGILSKTVSDLSQHNGAGASFNSRTALLTSTIHMIEDHPLVGTGWGTWSAVYPQYRSSQDVESAGYRAHCDYLEAWSSGGVGGLVEMLAVPLLLFFGARGILARAGTRRYAFAGIFAGSAVLVVQASVNFIYHQSGIVALSGALLGALYALPREEKEPIVTSRTIVWRGVGILALFSSLYLALVTYFSAVPVDIMLRPRSTEGILFGHYMTKENLTMLSKLNPISGIPDFAIANKYTIDGALASDDKVRVQQFDLALQYYVKSAKRAPFDPSIPYREALIYGVYPGLDSATRYQRTMAALDEALALNPRYPAAVEAYVQTAIQTKHYDLARACLEKAMRHAPVADQRPLHRLMNSVEAAEANGKLSDSN